MQALDFETFQQVLALHTDYALACDSADWERWPDFFTQDGSYRLQPRENHEQGLPLCLLAYLLPTAYTYTGWWPWVKNYGGEMSVGSIRPGPIYARIWIDQELKKKLGH